MSSFNQVKKTYLVRTLLNYLLPRPRTHHRANAWTPVSPGPLPNMFDTETVSSCLHSHIGSNNKNKIKQPPLNNLGLWEGGLYNGHGGIEQHGKNSLILCNSRKAQRKIPAKGNNLQTDSVLFTSTRFDICLCTSFAHFFIWDNKPSYLWAIFLWVYVVGQHIRPIAWKCCHLVSWG